MCTCVYSTEIQRVCSELALLTVGTLSVLFFLLHTLLCFLLIGRYRSGRWQFEPRPRHRLRLLHDYLDFGSHHVRGTPADINDPPETDILFKLLLSLKDHSDTHLGAVGLY